MAINRIDGPNSLAMTMADYQAQNNLQVAAFDGANIVPFSGSAMTIGAVIRVGGTTYRVNTATAITGTQSDYVKITPSGATATASFVDNLTGVSWNAVNGGYYDVGGNLYLFDEEKALAKGIVSEKKTGFPQYRIMGTTTITATGAGTYVVPDGVRWLIVKFTGGAGGGGGGAGLSSGPSYVTGSTGGTGGTTTFNSISAIGGAGGAGGDASNSAGLTGYSPYGIGYHTARTRTSPTGSINTGANSAIVGANAGGGGGSINQYSKELFLSVTSGQSISYTVGAGGAGGAGGVGGIITGDTGGAGASGSIYITYMG